MTKLFTIGILTLGILCGCSNGSEESGDLKNLEEYMVDISEFKIDTTVLNDGDHIEILGASGKLTLEHKIDFYNLVVVRSERTGDTINVLITTFFEPDLNNSRIQFISNSSVIGKILEHNGVVKNGTDVDDLKSKSYKRVFYDSEFIQVDVRKYPAIPGNLANYTVGKSSEETNK